MNTPTMADSLVPESCKPFAAVLSRKAFLLLTKLVGLIACLMLQLRERHHIR